MRLRYADDFQALENFKITEVKLEPMGFPMDTLEVHHGDIFGLVLSAIMLRCVEIVPCFKKQ